MSVASSEKQGKSVGSGDGSTKVSIRTLSHMPCECFCSGVAAVFNSEEVEALERVKVGGVGDG